MKLADFEFIPKSESGILGNQMILDFGKYHLSIIDDGYGRDEGLYEIAIFENGGFVRLPGISDPDDDVLGRLSEDNVNGIISKLFVITGVEPTQV